MAKKEDIGYCLKCKKHITMKSPKVVKKSGRRFNMGKCPKCGTKVCRILGSK